METSVFLFSESYINKNPNYRYHKDVLYKVCLAKKMYEFDNMDANAKEIQDVLYFVFPNLQNAGDLCYVSVSLTAEI